MTRVSIILAIIIWICTGCQTSEDKQPPNVLMICIDDLNTFIGCMGYDGVHTPNLDRLASRGVLFTNAHCQAPLCGPSRASIMTGLRPSTTGIYGQIKDKDLQLALEPSNDVSFLPQYFKDHGYYTMGVGKIFHQHAPEGLFDESGGRERGFGPKPPDDQYFKWNNKGTSTDWGPYPANDSAMPDYRSARWAAERLEREYDQPFFMAVGFLRPHVPWYVPSEWFGMYDTAHISTPPYRANDFDDIPAIVDEIDHLPMFPSTEWAMESGEWKNIIRAYLACITFVDHYVGEVLDALDNGPHSDNTIVVLWSDHGYRMGEKGTFAKHCLWDEATRVPLIFSGPGLPQNKKIDKPAELLSIYPTLVELCDLPPNPENEGHSLLPLMEEKSPVWDHPAITTYGMGNHAIVHERFRYIQYEDGSEELYNRAIDPDEWDNLASDISNDEVMRRILDMRKMLPERNHPWSPYSYYGVNEYFRRTSDFQ